MSQKLDNLMTFTLCSSLFLEGYIYLDNGLFKKIVQNFVS
jgi:hypothetical protein